MPAENNYVDTLIIKYLQENLSEIEQTELFDWVAASATNKELFKKITSEGFAAAEIQKLYQYDETTGWDKVRNSFSFQKTIQPKKINWQKWAVAASIIGLLFMGGFAWYNLHNNKISSVTIAKTDIKAPTSTKATITMANGQTVALDSINSGTLAKEGSINVEKTTDGRVVYSGTNAAVGYNTLINPRGSKVVNITLQDGTTVWLNSESSLKYPAAFVGNERNVELTGEAYFEVAKNPNKRFIVGSNGAEIQVLGTHFNVNTYADERNMKVTLLEGSVKVAKGTISGLLKPGQQAQVADDIKVVDNADINEAIAWKDGYFHFESADLKTILRQFARWYNIDIIYEGETSDEKYFIIINRNSTLVDVLKSLQSNNIKFRIEGKKLYIQSQ